MEVCKARNFPQILNKGMPLAMTVFRGSRPENRRRVQRRNDGWHSIGLLHCAVRLRKPELGPEQGLGGNSTQTDDEPGSNGLQFCLQPRPASVNLFHVRLLVDAQLSARFPLEVFDRVCYIYLASVDASLSQTLIQQLSSRSDKWPSLTVLLVTRLFPNHHDVDLRFLCCRSTLQFPKHRLSGIFIQVTSAALLHRLRKDGQ